MHTVVVLNYRGKEDTLACLAGLREGPHSASVRVVLVDNGSGDGVLEEALTRWPEVETVQLLENEGFTGGMNAGLRVALGSTSDSVTILNNDTLVSASDIVRLGREAVSRRAAVSPTIYYADDPARLWFGGGTMQPETCLPRHMSPAEVSEYDRTHGAGEPREVAILAGCCVTAPVSIWTSVGLLDEDYFLFFEDSEWSVRALDRGVPLLVLRDVAIRHKVSASFKGDYSFLGTYYYTRNGLRFHQLMGASPLVSARFLRRHPIPPVVRAVREGRFWGSFKLGVLVCAAVGHRLVGRYGRAPAWTERLAGAPSPVGARGLSGVQVPGAMAASAATRDRRS